MEPSSLLMGLGGSGDYQLALVDIMGMLDRGFEDWKR
jgi:hypothetical protein